MKNSLEKIAAIAGLVVITSCIGVGAGVITKSPRLIKYATKGMAASTILFAGSSARLIYDNIRTARSKKSDMNYQI